MCQCQIQSLLWTQFMNWKVSWTIFHVSDVVQTGSEPDGILRKLCLGWQKIGGASQRLQLWKAICKGFIWSRGSSIFWQHFLFGNSKSLREPWNWLVCFITVLAQKLNRNCMDSCQFVFFFVARKVLLIHSRACGWWRMALGWLERAWYCDKRGWQVG